MTEEIRGRVIQAQSGFFSVEIGEKIVVCQLRGRLKKGRKLADIVAIGDWVIITEQEPGKGMIEEVWRQLLEGSSNRSLLPTLIRLSLFFQLPNLNPVCPCWTVFWSSQKESQ